MKLSIMSRWVVIMLLAMTSRAFALPNYSPSNLGALTNENVETLVKSVAVGADHRGYMPASPLGIALGLDVGVEVTAISLPDEFIASIATATGTAASNIINPVPSPKLNIHKGLPKGIDLGFTFFTFQDMFKVYGADVKWTFLDGGLARPAIAARVSASYNKIWFLGTRSLAFDVLISKSLAVIEPYGGVGLQTWSGDLWFSPQVSSLAPGIDAHHSSTSPRVFGGMVLKLVFLRLTAEVNYSFAKVLSYGGKFSFNL